MTTAILVFIAVFSTAVLIALWFRTVRQELYEKQKAVDAARCQLAASRQQCFKVSGGPEEAMAREIFIRSQNVCFQAEKHYNDTLKTLWNAAPAWFLGFRRLSADENK